MTEPVLDRGQTWEQFYRSTARKISELEVGMNSMEWWELEQAKGELAELRFYLYTAERFLNDDSR
jgi:hypothetical protein